MFDHLREANPTESIEYASGAYHNLITGISRELPPNHHITYVPFRPEQADDTTEHVHYAGANALPTILRDADIVIDISRDEDPTPSYSEQYPEYNITLTPSGCSNVDTAVALFTMARQQGNEDIRFIATGRMHNRAVRAMLALPVVAEHIGLNAEDLYHIPEAQFRRLLQDGFHHSPELQLNPDDPALGFSYKALIALLEDPKYGAAVPTVGSSDEDRSKVVTAIAQEYASYPRISTSRLMVERAVQRGVPREAVYEEDGAVDTITNLINVAHMLQSDDFTDFEVRKVVIVAGSDHLPRTMWIADHILPDGIEIVCVESDPALPQEAYDASCIRELNSFSKGSKWIGGTRDIHELDEITESGYFGADRKETAELARYVMTQQVHTDT